ncbi:MAG: Fic family protein [Candidatus Micrarchaeota archaeon]
MTTKWDCLFALFELKEARLGDIARKAGASPSSTRQMLLALLKKRIILQSGGKYAPNKGNKATWQIFEIMKFARDRGINHNLLLAKEFSAVLKIGLGHGTATLADFGSLNYNTVRKYLTYLSRINLLLVVSKKPLRVKFVHEPVFDEILALAGLEPKAPKPPAHPAPTSGYREILALLKKLRQEKKNIDFSKIEQERKIEFTSASTQLEGNTFTLEQSKDLILHDTVPHDKKLREANEVRNYYAAVDHLLRLRDEPISTALIMDLHRIAIFNLGVKEGARSPNVSIAGNPFYKMSRFQDIYPQLEALCAKINDFTAKKRSVKEAVEFATFVHNEFQHIHPFEDGNSRVTRLLWNHVLLKSGFPLINIYSNAREEYLSLTKMARHRDDGKLNAFLVRVIQDNLYKLTRLEP